MPITLKTLEQASAQKVFDQVAAHMLDQDRQAISETGACMYLMTAEDGTLLRCAAGCLIADDEYKEEMEGNDWACLDVPEAHSALISDLQSIHDCHSPEYWRGELKALALRRGLDVVVLQR